MWRGRSQEGKAPGKMENNKPSASYHSHPNTESASSNIIFLVAAAT